MAHLYCHRVFNCKDKTEERIMQILVCEKCANGDNALIYNVLTYTSPLVAQYLQTVWRRVSFEDFQSA